MVTKWVHAPEHIVEPESEPAQRLVVPPMKRRNHPADLFPTQTSVVRILQEIHRVVPFDEAVLKHGVENKRYDQNQESRYRAADIPCRL